MANLENITSLNNLQITWSANDGNNVISFELLKDVDVNDPTEIEMVLITPDLVATNVIGGTTAFLVTVTVADIPYANKIMLANATKTQDKTTVLTITDRENPANEQIFSPAIPLKNHLFHQSYPESIESKRVNIVFKANMPKTQTD